MACLSVRIATLRSLDQGQLALLHIFIKSSLSRGWKHLESSNQRHLIQKASTRTNEIRSVLWCVVQPWELHTNVYNLWKGISLTDWRHVQCSNTTVGLLLVSSSQTPFDSVSSLYWRVQFSISYHFSLIEWCLFYGTQDIRLMFHIELKMTITEWPRGQGQPQGQTCIFTWIQGVISFMTLSRY